MNSQATLQQLTEILEQRKTANARESYVASLYESGLEKILDKINEETLEVVEAAREKNTEHLIHEVADLWFHCMVLLAEKNLSYENILTELDNRFGISGLVEKAQRK